MNEKDISSFFYLVFVDFSSMKVRGRVKSTISRPPMYENLNVPIQIIISCDSTSPLSVQ